MKILPILLAAAAAFVLPATATAKERPAIERMPAVILGGKPLPFSEGVRVGDMLYLSGQVGVGPDGKLPEGIDAQSRIVLDRIGTSLASAGLGWKHVVRCMVMLKDMADWPGFNTIYASYIDPQNLPARSAFGANGLALGALVEVQCDAHVPATK
ncbi:MAG: RidA family protein [Sphingobium sp.]